MKCESFYDTNDQSIPFIHLFSTVTFSRHDKRHTRDKRQVIL